MPKTRIPKRIRIKVYNPKFYTVEELYDQAITRYPNNPSNYVALLWGWGDIADGDNLMKYLESIGEWED